MSAVRRIGGFTLIELLVCIVVLAVLAAVAAPRFMDHQPFSERGYAAEVAGALRAARNTAIANECDVLITLDPLTGYRAMARALTGGVCLASGAFSVAVRLPDGNLLAHAPPANVVGGPLTQVQFDKDGNVAAVPAPYVIGAFTITVSPTGYVTL